MLLFSCNKRVQADMHREQVPDYQEVKADSLLIEDYDNIQKYSPAFIYSENYTTIQRGTYMPKSISKQFVESAQNIIDGYRLKDTTLVKNFDGCCMYLANDKPIALFSNRNPKSKEDVAGIFKGGSLVMVDTVFYNSVYLDSDKAPMSFEKWYSLLDSDSIQFDDPPLTYDAWYAIRINGKKYYTDYKLHNYIEYSTYIPEKKQMLLICSQGTGYDTVYDSGYPDFYEIAVLEKSSTDNAWVQVYRSLKLDLNNGGAEEYGISGFFISDESWTGLDSQGNFVIKLGNLCEMIWTGKELSVNWYKNDD
jgi:hypothetical protein